MNMKTTTVMMVVSIIFWTLPSWAQSEVSRIDELEAKTLALSNQLEELRAELKQAKQQGTVSELAVLQKEVKDANRSAKRAEKSANEWKDTKSVTHVAGYAAVGYTNEENGNDAFDLANFNPIFHFQYGDRILWESELEVEVEEDGSTKVVLEYSTIDYFINDRLTLVAGKFISPIGNFRQNLHPSWINKLPSAPPGFGHDGAAPLAEVGVQLRGVLPFDQTRKLTYAGYVGNGPKLEGEDGEIHGIDTDGFAGDADDEKIIGGRLSILPFPKLEIGISGAVGNASVVENDEEDFEGDPARDYRVFGVDVAYQWSDLDLRAEYVQQDVDDNPLSIAPEGGKWETWYVQGAYKFGQAKWESVLRYTDYRSPHANRSQEQWALGLNYLITPSALFKVAYEFNDGLTGEATDNDRFLFQLAYGY